MMTTGRIRRLVRRTMNAGVRVRLLGPMVVMDRPARARQTRSADHDGACGIATNAAGSTYVAAAAAAGGVLFGASRGIADSWIADRSTQQIGCRDADAGNGFATEGEGSRYPTGSMARPLACAILGAPTPGS